MPSQPIKPPTSKSRKQSLPSIAVDAVEIESCETRLALSASLAADMLLDALEIQPLSASQPTDTIDSGSQLDSQLDSQPDLDSGPDSDLQSPDLLSQAAELRQSYGLDGSGQTIAVIDSGIAFDHVALGGGFGPGYRVVGGYDFAEDDAIPYDDGPAGFHGTHVAGLLGGSTDTFQGVAPGADLVALRVFDDNGAGELEYIESALRYVHDNKDSFASPITTVNLSVGAALTAENHAEATALLADELQLLRDDNILVFAASGNFFGSDNGGNEEVLFPASEPNVVAITSIDADGSLSDFAQRESNILATRGEDIFSSVPDHVFGVDGNVDDFASLNGTSQATPQAAGASVLIRQSLIDQGIEPTADAILSRLYQSSQINVDPITGVVYNTIDLSQAITSDPLTSDLLTSDLLTSDLLTSDLLTSDPVTSGPVASEPLASEPVVNDPGISDPITSTQTASDPITDNSIIEIDASEIANIVGSTDSEDVQLDLSDGIKLQVGDSTYSLKQNSNGDPLVIDAGSGADSIQIIGSDATERLIARPASASGDVAGDSTISTNEFEIQLRGFENISFDGGGGRDRATLYDSAGDDTFSSGPDETVLEGIGFRLDVTDVSRVYAYGSTGGHDTAFLYDTAGDDRLSVRPQFSSLRADDSFTLAYEFERVFAYANNGGTDTAEIYDSAGDDVLSVSANRSIITGDDYQVSARGFSSIISHATAGGDDIAKIYADDTFNQFSSTDDMVQWTDQNGDVRIVRGFERVDAFENFQPITLTTLSEGSPFSQESISQSLISQSLIADDDDRQELAVREADVSRSIFADLGRE